MDSFYEGLMILIESWNSKDSKRALDMAIKIHKFNQLREECKDILEQNGYVEKIISNLYDMYTIYDEYVIEFPKVADRMFAIYSALKRRVKEVYDIT